jgi:hypothetical protein
MTLHEHEKAHPDPESLDSAPCPIESSKAEFIEPEDDFASSSL